MVTTHLMNQDGEYGSRRCDKDNTDKKKTVYRKQWIILKTSTQSESCKKIFMSLDGN